MVRPGRSVDADTVSSRVKHEGSRVAEQGEVYWRLLNSALAGPSHAGLQSCR